MFKQCSFHAELCVLNTKFFLSDLRLTRVGLKEKFWDRWFIRLVISVNKNQNTIKKIKNTGLSKTITSAAWKKQWSVITWKITIIKKKKLKNNNSKFIKWQALQGKSSIIWYSNYHLYFKCCYWRENCKLSELANSAPNSIKNNIDLETLKVCKINTRSPHSPEKNEKKFK